MSHADGLPDTNSFVFVDYNTDSISWTSDNRLILDAVDRGRRSWHQVHIWDDGIVENVVQLTDATGYHARWSRDGRWAFLSSFQSEEQVVIVRDKHNETIAKLPGHMALAWSADGQLAYSSGHKKLSVWNGEQHIQLTDSTWETYGRWQSGTSLHFSFWVG